jgi:hypothetical protein
VYKTLWPQFVHSFRGFKKEEIYQDVVDIIVKVASKLKLEADTTDVEDIESHGAELSNENVMES